MGSVITKSDVKNTGWYFLVWINYTEILNQFPKILNQVLRNSVLDQKHTSHIDVMEWKITTNVLSLVKCWFFGFFSPSFFEGNAFSPVIHMLQCSLKHLDCSVTEDYSGWDLSWTLCLLSTPISQSSVVPKKHPNSLHAFILSRLLPLDNSCISTSPCIP